MTIDRMTINQPLLSEPPFPCSPDHRKFLDQVNGEWESLQGKRADIAQREAAIKATPAAELDGSHAKTLRALRRELIEICRAEVALKPRLIGWHSLYLADAIAYAATTATARDKLEQELHAGLLALGFAMPMESGLNVHRMLMTNARYKAAAEKAENAIQHQRAAIARQAGIRQLDTARAEAEIRKSIEAA